MTRALGRSSELPEPHAGKYDAAIELSIFPFLFGNISVLPDGIIKPYVPLSVRTQHHSPSRALLYYIPLLVQAYVILKTIRPHRNEVYNLDGLSRFTSI